MEPESALGPATTLRHIMSQTFDRGCDQWGRTEGRGCDTVLFSDRSRDTVVGYNNHPHVTGNHRRRVGRILLRQRFGGCR